MLLALLLSVVLRQDILTIISATIVQQLPITLIRPRAIIQCFVCIFSVHKYGSELENPELLLLFTWVYLFK